MDTCDHLSIENLQQAAVIVAALVYNTAMRTGLLPASLCQRLKICV
jgi:carboxypeptidase Q